MEMERRGTVDGTGRHYATASYEGPTHSTVYGVDSRQLAYTQKHLHLLSLRYPLRSFVCRRFRRRLARVHYVGLGARGGLVGSSGHAVVSYCLWQTNVIRKKNMRRSWANVHLLHPVNPTAPR
eukprot:scaffold26759_cov30-Tisochrysis_lutea.AAC.3